MAEPTGRFRMFIAPSNASDVDEKDTDQPDEN